MIQGRLARSLHKVKIFLNGVLVRRSWEPGMVVHIFNPSGGIKIFKHSGGRGRWISVSFRTARAT